MIKKESVRFDAFMKAFNNMKRIGYSKEKEMRLGKAMLNRWRVSNPIEEFGKPLRFMVFGYLLRKVMKFWQTAR